MLVYIAFYRNRHCFFSQIKKSNLFHYLDLGLTFTTLIWNLVVIVALLTLLAFVIVPFSRCSSSRCLPYPPLPSIGLAIHQWLSSQHCRRRCISEAESQPLPKSSLLTSRRLLGTSLLPYFYSRLPLFALLRNCMVPITLIGFLTSHYWFCDKCSNFDLCLMCHVLWEHVLWVSQNYFLGQEPLFTLGGCFAHTVIDLSNN